MRRPMPQKEAAIACIDIGGTAIKSGYLVKGRLTGVRQTPTCAQQGAKILLKTVEGLIAAMPQVQGVGISTAGEVDTSGTIVLCDNIPGYTGCNVKQQLQKRLGMPVAVENDVNAAAIGEHAFGAARGYRDFAMISYGTGVGGALFVNGALYRGSSCSAGEFGGILTHPEHVCPQRQGTGSYERYASTTALVAKAAAAFPEIQNGCDVFARLQTPEIQAVVNSWIDEVSYGLVSILHACNPAAMVLGGGVMGQAYILEQLHIKMAPMVKSSFRGCKIVPAALGNNAGLMGAAALAQKQMEEAL